MSELDRLIALVQQHGLEGWSLIDTHRLKESAHQHAEALRLRAGYAREDGNDDLADDLRAAASFLVDGKAE